MPERVVIWDDGNLTVTVYYDEGDLVIYGDHFGTTLMSTSEYEYWLRVPESDIAALCSALGGSEDSKPSELLINNAAELVQKGESTWLKEHDIPFKFSSWISSD